MHQVLRKGEADTHLNRAVRAEATQEVVKMQVQEHGKKLLKEKAASYAPSHPGFLNLQLKTTNISTGTEMPWNCEINQYNK
jgi:hypothetical protein